MLLLTIFFLTFGMSFSFLFQNGATNHSTMALSDKSYQDIISLLVDEKNERKQFETMITNRLSQIDELHNKVSVQIDKDKNSREYTTARLAEFAHQLQALTDSERSVKSGTENNTIQITTQSRDIANSITQIDSIADYIAWLNKTITNMIDSEKHAKSEIDNNKRELTNHSQDIGNLSTHMDTIFSSIARVNKTVANMNKQVGFSVNEPDKAQQPPDGPLKFSRTLFNSNFMYNSSTGIVTCNTPGLYYISVTIVREPGIGQAYCCVHVNNISKVCTVGYPSSTSGYGSGGTAIVHHLTGETIYLGCSRTDHMHWSSGFNGFLIQADIP